MRNIKSIFLLLIVALSLNGCKEDDDFPVPPASTVPKFSYTISNDGYAPATVVFTNESIVPDNAGSVTFTWNFGDGTSSVEENPTHEYQEAGAYTANLVAVTSSSLEVKETSQTILVKDPNESGTMVYFTDGSGVYTGLASELIETPVFTMLAGVSLQASYGMTIDTINDKLYISDTGANAIYRCELDGSNFIIFRSGVDTPNALAIDYQENELYWDTSNGIQKASLDVEDQSQKEDVVSGQSNDPDGIAIDQANRTLYWVNYNGGLWRKNLDGSGETELNPVVEGGSIIVVDDRIYYDEYVASGDIRLKSADLNGGNVTTLATNITRVVYGLAYEAASNKIYWGDRNVGTIMRANLDGSEAEPWYFQDGSSPRGICFGKEI